MSKYLNKEGLQRLWEHITSELGGKVDKVSGKGLSTNDYTTAEKTKLSGIDEGANKTIVDTELLTGSNNPVQNKIVTARINTLETAITSINNNKATDFTDNDDVHYPTVKAVSNKIAADISDSTADWDENDESATDYVKNRTHYSQVSGSNIVEVQSLQLTEAAHIIETSESTHYSYSTTTTTEVPYTLSVLRSASYFTLKYNISSGSTKTDTAYLIECSVTDSSGSTASAVGLIFAQAGLSVCFNTSGNTVHFMSNTSQSFDHFQIVAQNANVVKQIDNAYISEDTIKAAELYTRRYIDGLGFRGDGDVTHYGYCNSAAATAAKIAPISSIKLVTGARVLVRFTYGNLCTSGISLNVNGLGAKPIYYQGQPYSSKSTLLDIQPNQIVGFVYNGTAWCIEGFIPTITSPSSLTIDDGSID